MEFFKNLANALIDTKDMIVEKNKKNALINRLRAVIKCEEQSCERAFIALGRYYYHNLRDASDPATEPHCAAIDAAEARLDCAIEHLEKLYHEDNSDNWTEEVTLEDVVEITEEQKQQILGEEEAAACAEVSEETAAAEESAPNCSEAADDNENDHLIFE